jgi:hypothetical protein
MKKIFTLFFALFTFAFFANAQQVTIILEAHDVWEDGSGYQLLLDADHNTYGTIIPATGPLSTSGDVPASVYAEFEYTVPANADGSLTTTNMVYDGSVTITIPAGTYDFCVTNPTPDDCMWIAGGESRQDDYVFSEEYIYHFTVARQGQGDAVTIVMTPATDDPTIMVTPTDIEMTAAIGGTAIDGASVTGYNLTSDITVSASAPFAVGLTSATAGPTATISSNGGVFFITYSPTTAETESGTITLTSGTATATINVTGIAIDCNDAPIPYFTDFTNDAMNQCWTIVDANNDDKTFSFDTGNGYAIYVYDTLNNANDWLISPVFQLGNTATAAFDYATGGYTTEKYSVYVIGDGQTYANATLVLPTQNVTNTSWETQYVDLSNYANQSIKVAIKCESDADDYLFGITNFNVFDEVPSSMELSAAALNYGTVPAGDTRTAMIEISTINVNEDINITTAAPFGVSYNGSNFTSSVTIPANTELTVVDTFYVQFAPTAAGNFNDMVIVSTSTISDTIELTAIGIECNVITNFPFNENFEETSLTRGCWTILDANNDGSTFSFYDGLARCKWHSTNDADDWLISPQITFTGSQIATLDYWAGSANWNPETFQVFAINEETNIALTAEIDVTNTSAENLTIDLSSLNGTYKIGIHCISEHDMYYLYIDNFNISDASEPSLTVNPTSMTFSTAVGTASSAITANVTGLALANDITVSAPANFEVSTDNSTFAASATITAATGLSTQALLYVRYNPAAAGSHTGIVTLTSGTASASINVTGSAIDCSTATNLPFFEDFEDEELNECWTLIDNDGDGKNWYILHNTATTTYVTHSGEGIMTSASYQGAVLTPDNWLITPAINLSENATLSFWVAGQDPSYASEVFSVYLSTTGTSINDFNVTLLDHQTATGEMTEYTANLSAYTGSNVHIAFRHHDVSDMFRLNLDDVSVTAGVGINEVDNTTVNVYPNPAHNYINVNATSNISNIEVYSIAGQKVADFTANGAQTVINTSELSNGLYIMRINTENGTINKKFSVAR